MNDVKLKLKGTVEVEVESGIEVQLHQKRDSDGTLCFVVSLQSPSQNYDEKPNTEDDNKVISKKTTIDSNVNAFINNKGIETEIDKCLAVIYFMNKKEGVECFTTPIIREKMQQAKLYIPKNISAIFHHLTKKGYIQPENRDFQKITEYYLTHEGERYIENYEKKERKGKISSRKNKSISSGIESSYSFLTKEMMKLDRYPDISKLKYTKEKVMLVMYIMKDIRKGEYFTVNDLKYIISNIFNDRISDDSIKGVFKNKTSAKYFDKRHVVGSKKYVEYKMIPSGFNYFKENVLNN